jgi:branched-chain amino acid transport system substrate-binding protein
MRNVIRYESRFIFRLLPNSNDFAKALVAFFIQQQYQRLALLYSRDSYNEEVAYAFRDYAVAKGLTIVYEKSFFDYQQNFAAISADMKELDIDAIFLTTFVDTAMRVVEDMHNLGITTPLIGSDALDSDRFAETLGSVGNGIVVPTIYNPFSKKAENASFVNAYRRAYGTSPDTWAAQGYDAVQLLAYAMNDANSTMPANIATALRYMPPQKRASGDFVFKQNGELQNKAIYFKELQNGEFVLFKDRKQEAEQSQNIELLNDRIFWRPEKPSESTEALSIQ